MEFQSLDLGDVVGHLTGLLRTAVGTGTRLEVESVPTRRRYAARAALLNRSS